jgi:hypothetical protein
MTVRKDCSREDRRQRSWGDDTPVVDNIGLRSGVSPAAQFATSSCFGAKFYSYTAATPRIYAAVVSAGSSGRGKAQANSPGPARAIPTRRTSKPYAPLYLRDARELRGAAEEGRHDQLRWGAHDPDSSRNSGVHA